MIDHHELTPYDLVTRFGIKEHRWTGPDELPEKDFAEFVREAEAANASAEAVR